MDSVKPLERTSKSAAQPVAESPRYAGEQGSLTLSVICLL